MAALQELISGLLTRDMAVTIFGAASGATGIPAFVLFWLSRRDRIRREGLTDEQRRTEEYNKREASLDAEKATWFAEIRQENRDLKVELIETRRDRDRGWNFARGWHGKAHAAARALSNCRHHAANMQQWIDSLARRDAAIRTLVPDDPFDGKAYQVPMPMQLEDLTDGDV